MSPALQVVVGAWLALCSMRMAHIAGRFVRGNKTPYFQYGFDVILLPVVAFRLLLNQVVQVCALVVGIIVSDIKEIPSRVKEYLSGWTI